MLWRQPYTIVDTHCHSGLLRYEPIETLIDQMFRNGVNQAVLTQYMGQYDNRYLSECCQRFPGRFAVAALVDVRKPDAPEMLGRWADYPGFRGVRLECADPEPVWQKANELGMAVSLRGTAQLLAAEETRRRIAKYERINFCIEHIGAPDVREEAPYPIYRTMLRLAELPNVWVKASGYGGFSKRHYPYEDVVPFARMTLDAFGPRRMMWGSDFPWTSIREGYRNALGLVELLYPGLSQDEHAWLIGKTAQQVWSLDDTVSSLC